MMKMIFRILISAFAIVVAAYLVPGVAIESYRVAIVVVIVLAIANGLIGTLLRFLTLPLNILTLGLMSGIITVCMVLLADYFVAGFETGGFISAAIFAIVLALINMVFGIDSDK